MRGICRLATAPCISFRCATRWHGEMYSYCGTFWELIYTLTWLFFLTCLVNSMLNLWSPQTQFHRRNIANLSRLYRHFHCESSDDLNSSISSIQLSKVMTCNARYTRGGGVSIPLASSRKKEVAQITASSRKLLSCGHALEMRFLRTLQSYPLEVQCQTLSFLKIVESSLLSFS